MGSNKGTPSALPTWLEGTTWGGHADDFTAWETELHSSYRKLFPADVFDVESRTVDGDKGV